MDSESMVRADFLQAFGMRVRLLRTKQRMTQRELGLASGLDRTFVGSVERGQRGLSVSTLPRLAAGLRVTPEELFADDDLRAAVRRVAMHQVMQEPAQAQGRAERVSQ